MEIVGVIGDTSMRTLGEEHAAMLVTPYEDAQLIVRTAGGPARWVAPLHDLLAQADPASAVDIRPLSDAAAGAIFPMRVAAGSVASVGGIGLFLALSGLYSSISYAARRRTREMAIRMAVGAARSAILWAAIRDGVAVLCCGILIGLPLTIAAIQPLANILPDGLDPWSPAMFTAVIFILLATGAAAGWIAVRSATKLEPSSILKYD